MEKISVIIPTYNRGYCIEKSIKSVLNQSYTEIELIIVDDASTDDTKAVVDGFDDRRIRYIKLLENKGVSNARNVGLELAIGDYIAFQDSDDYWLSDKMEKQLNCIKNTKCDFCFTYIKYTLENNEEIIVPDKNLAINLLNGNIYNTLLYCNLVGAPTLLMKRECYENVGKFNVDYPALEDWDYALRLAKKYKACFVSEPLLEATQSKISISGNIINHLMGCCIILGKYKIDYLEMNLFDKKILEITELAQECGVLETILPFLEFCIGKL